MTSRLSLAQTIKEFGALSGSTGDTDWAGRAAFQLLDTYHIKESKAQHALAAALSTMTAAHSSPGTTSLSAIELFGDPAQWAAERAEQWRDDGEDAIADDRPLSPRSIVVTGMALSSFTAVLFWIVMILEELGETPFSSLTRFDATLSPDGTRDGWFPAFQVLAPFVISVGSLLVIAIYQRILRRYSFIAAAAAGSLIVAVLAFGYGIASHLLNSAASLTAMWMLMAAMLYGVLAYLLSRLWKEIDVEDSTPLPPSDEQWLRELGESLRGRGDLNDRTAARIASEAREYARDSRNSLDEEFGDPTAYAHRFAPRPTTSEARTVGYNSAMVLLVVILAVATHTPIGTTSAFSTVLMGMLILAVIQLGVSIVRLWRARTKP